MTVAALYNEFQRIKNASAFTCIIRQKPLHDQIKLAEFLCTSAYIKSHRQKAKVDDRKVLYHPIEEEIVKAICSGIDMDEFIADLISTGDCSTASARMIKRRWYKIEHLLQVYQAYSSASVQI